MSSIPSWSPVTRLKGELPPSGPLPSLMQTLGCRWFAYDYMTECRNRLGRTFTVYPIYMAPIVFLCDHRDIRAMLTADAAHLHPGAGAAVIAPLIGAGSFMLAEEEEHICARRSITPAFTRTVSRHHLTNLREFMKHEIATWPRDTVMPSHDLLRQLTLKSILAVLFSDSPELRAKLYSLLIRMFEVTTSFVFQQPNLRHLPGWRSTWTTFLKERDEVDTLLYGVIEDRRAQAAEPSKDLLGSLLAANNPDGSPMPDSQVRDNLMSLILAGHETTAGELSWALQLLAHNQDAQDRLIQELDQGSTDDYLTATIHETLRHKPVFLFTIPRKVVVPTEIGGHMYYPPTHLAGCTYLLHHDPSLYPDPHRFKPERFLTEAPQNGTWLPWGGGRKHCLGRHFALEEMKLILRELLSNCRVLPASKRIEHPRWRSAILVPHAGGRVILRSHSG